MNYYLVKTKCGHVGLNRYMPIVFAVMAESGREAAMIARQIPRVKHNHWDAILECKRVDEETFNNQRKINRSNPYLIARSKHEQLALIPNIEDLLEIDDHQNELKLRNRKSAKPNLLFQKKKYQEKFKGGEQYEEYSIC